MTDHFALENAYFMHRRAKSASSSVDSRPHVSVRGRRCRFGSGRFSMTEPLDPERERLEGRRLQRLRLSQRLAETHNGV
ncbi:hypothetical protein Plhal304r1_c081g0166681 [Plasmopara halstedii]